MCFLTCRSPHLVSSCGLERGGLRLGSAVFSSLGAHMSVCLHSWTDTGPLRPGFSQCGAPAPAAASQGLGAACRRGSSLPAPALGRSPHFQLPGPRLPLLPLPCPCPETSTSPPALSFVLKAKLAKSTSCSRLCYLASCFHVLWTQGLFSFLLFSPDCRLSARSAPRLPPAVGPGPAGPAASHCLPELVPATPAHQCQFHSVIRWFLDGLC